MKLSNGSPEIRLIYRVTVIVQFTIGFCLGIYCYTYGPLFVENFSRFVSEESAMNLSGLVLGLMCGLIVLLEIPTGAMGDAIGRRKTVIWSFLCRGLFFIFLSLVPFSTSLSDTLIVVLLAVSAFAFGYTFYSGSFTAWCVDSLKRCAPTLGYEHILARGYTFNFLGTIIGGILGNKTKLFGSSDCQSIARI